VGGLVGGRAGGWAGGWAGGYAGGAGPEASRRLVLDSITTVTTPAYPIKANPNLAPDPRSPCPPSPGVGFTLVDAATTSTAVNVAAQQDPSYGPIVQFGSRFGDYAGIDIHPTTGRVWSANIWVWSPYYAVDGQAVVSNAGARVTIFS
jgi:hypothetical protein